MKRKIIAILLALGMAMILSGCRGRDGGTVSYATQPSSTNETLESEVIEVEGEEPESWSVEFDSSEQEVSDTEQSGIIALIVSGSTNKDFTVISIDPATGETQIIAEFLSQNWSYDQTKFSLDLHWTQENLPELISPDCTKLAITLTTLSTYERHAGWIDSDGTFFDVTEALGLQSKSDFEEPAEYLATGFSRTGDFIFSDCVGTGLFTTTYYRASQDEITAGTFVEIGDASAFRTAAYTDGYFVTSQIDENRYIVDYEVSGIPKHHRQSVIYNVATGEVTDYIPSSSTRCSRSGILSPDGGQVAFLSESNRGNHSTGHTNLYVTALKGGEPTLIMENAPNAIADVSFFVLLGWQ